MIWLIDTTLRDGEQAPGVAFFRNEKLCLARMLDEVGIDEIEVGTPAMGVEECKTIRQIVRLGLSARISVWSRALKTDIEQAATTDAAGIHIAFPASDIQLGAMNKDFCWVHEMLPLTVEFARRHFQFVSVGIQDAGRCTPDRLAKFLQLAAASKVLRVRIADTVGILAPLQVADMLGAILNEFPTIDIDFHAHNDLGMATANALTAWQSGAQSLSVTVGGIGERAGNAALEEIVVILQQQHNIEKYKTEKLYNLCRYVSSVSIRPIPDGKPITGRFAFSHESGIHVKGTLANINAFQPFSGVVVGREGAQNLFGKHSSKAVVTDFLDKKYRKGEISFAPTNEIADFLLEKIKRIAEMEKRNIQEKEILVWYNKKNISSKFSVLAPE